MRTELYCVRSSKEEIAYINKNLKKIVNMLNSKATAKVLYKTEIDWSAKEIKADLGGSLGAHNPPELHIFINAIDTKDNSSFCSLFSPFLRALEKDIFKMAPPEYKKAGLYPHVQVYSVEGLPGEYPAYCFSFKRRKVLVLPEIKHMGKNPCDYICRATILAKDLLFRKFDSCPEGYTFTKDKPITLKERLAATFSRNKSESAKNTTKPIDETPKSTAESADNATTESATEPAANTGEDLTPEINFETPAVNIMDINENPADDIIIFDEEVAVQEQEPVANIIEEDIQISSEPIDSDPQNIDPDPEQPKKKAGFKGFIKSFIPSKGDSPKSLFLKIIVLIAIVGFITGAFLLTKFYVIDPGVNSANMEEIQDIFHSTVTQTVTDPEGNVIATADEEGQNWDKLKKINKEIVGWITLDKTKIDYPVLFHKEDNEKSQFYLYKNYKKKYSDFGSIFMDYRCEKGIDSKHVILHGHNMGSDDSMFGSLLNYSRYDGRTQGNVKFYKSAPVVNLYTPDGNSDWIIFAVMKIDVANNNKAIFNYLQTEFEGSAQYMNFIYNIKVRSYLDVNVPINENDRLLTLSTCSYETDNMRTIVVARQVRENEDVSKYIKSVKKSSPQGTVYTDFASEYAQGNLKWYDGKGKLKGNGELEFMEQKEMYKVTFVDAKGKKILSQYVLKGEDATAPVGAPPAKATDDTYYYSFKKWSPSFKNVTKDLTIKPVYDKYLKATTAPNEDTPVQNTPQVRPTETQAPQTQPPTTQAPQTQATTAPPVQTTPATEPTTLAPDPVESSTAQ